MSLFMMSRSWLGLDIDKCDVINSEIGMIHCLLTLLLRKEQKHDDAYCYRKNQEAWCAAA